MKYFFNIVPVILMTIMTGSSVFAQRWSLPLMEPMPDIQIADWINGQPFVQPREDGIRVLMFSWENCPGCVMALPLLNRIAKGRGHDVSIRMVYLDGTFNSFKGKTVRTREEKERTHNSIKQYARRIVDDYDIVFDVAIDNDEHDTHLAWKIQGVPAIFVIDGQSNLLAECTASELETVLNRIRLGIFDPWGFRREQIALKASFDSIYELEESGKQRDAIRLLDSLMDANPTVRGHPWKYRLIAEIDGRQGEEYLRWLLDVACVEVEWKLLADYASRIPETPNFSLVIEALEKVIQSAASDAEKIDAYMTKGSILRNITRIIKLKNLQDDAIPFLSRSRCAYTKALGVLSSRANVQGKRIDFLKRQINQLDRDLEIVRIPGDEN